MKAVLRGTPNGMRTEDINLFKFPWDFTQDAVNLGLVGNVNLNGCDFTPSLNPRALVSAHTGICYFL